MTKPMNCQTAQEQMQHLLDLRWSEPMPLELQEHLAQCQQCQSWQALFQLQSHSPYTELPANFSKQVLARYSREQRRSRWLHGSMLFAVAAALLVATSTWLSLPQPSSLAARPAHNLEAAQKQAYQFFNQMKQDLENLQTRVAQIPAPSFSLPTTFPQWNIDDVNDPLAISMPALRTLGNTLQGGFEPYEAPARETINKVKSMIDDPNVKKLVDTVKRRAM